MFIIETATVGLMDGSDRGEGSNKSSADLPELSDQTPETIAFLSGDGAALLAFHEAMTSLALGNLDQDGCESLVTDRLPAITDTPATVERLAQTVPDEGGRDLFVNEVYSAFDSIGVCTSGGAVGGRELLQHHSAVTAWLAELGL